MGHCTGRSLGSGHPPVLVAVPEEELVDVELLVALLVSVDDAVLVPEDVCVEVAVAVDVRETVGVADGQSCC